MNLDDTENYITFRRVNKYVFNVNNEFPKIDKNQCGDRIFEVKYYVSLDGISTIEEETYND